MLPRPTAALKRQSGSRVGHVFLSEPDGVVMQVDPAVRLRRRLNGDDGNDSFVGVTWVGSERVALTVRDRRLIRMDVDSATGRPLRSVSAGVGC